MWHALYVLCWVILSLCALLAVRLCAQLVAIRKHRRLVLQRTRQSSNGHPLAAGGSAPSFRLLCVLGSGGHTAEMMVLLADLLRSPAAPARVTYVATATDDHSLAKARRLHESLGTPSRPRATPVPVASFRKVPRAREVHQSWLSTVGSAARCLTAAVPVVVAARPDVVVVNGPGSAMIVVAVVLVTNAIGLTRAKTVYVESVARTKRLSLSGRLAYGVAHRFVVQWPGVLDAYPLAEYNGRLC
jgi:beta-1,4-N-acetylglucosaminyltransferase